MPPAHAADDATRVEAIVELVNRAYAAAERGLFEIEPVLASCSRGACGVAIMQKPLGPLSSQE